jgi:hypothetical protein
MAVAPWIVSDELWGLVEPLLPKVERRFRYPGRKRLPDRQALQGILFVSHGDLVAAFAGRAWLWLGCELLAAAGRVAEGRCLGAAARGAAGEVAGGG